MSARSNSLGLSDQAWRAAQCAAALIFLSSNVGLNFYNSWLLKKESVKVLVGGHVTTENAIGPVDGHPNFNFPIFYTMWHMVATVVGCTVILLTVARPPDGFPSFSQFMKYKSALVLIAACTSASIGLNNISLTLISLFLNQVIKASGPLPTMIFSAAINNKKYGWGTLVACCLIITGTILAIPTSSSSQQSTSITGVLLLLLSLLASSLKPVIMALVMKGTPDRPKLPPTVVLFYDTFLAFWFMLIYWIASNERQAVIDYFGSGNGAYAIGLILVGATLAFLFNLSNYFFVLLTSPLTVTVGGNVAKVVSIVIAAIIAHISDVRNWTGVGVVCVALSLYAYFSYLDSINPPTSLLSWPWGKGKESDIESKKPAENTPLKGSSTPTQSKGFLGISFQ